MITSLSDTQTYYHPVIENHGWWQRSCRVIYNKENSITHPDANKSARPLLIIGKNGTLGKAFAKICEEREINYYITCRNELDVTNVAQVEKVILEKQPWAVVNAAGFVKVDDAETQAANCYAINTTGAENLALLCEKYGIKMLTFSTDLVFDGSKSDPYTESDNSAPLNVYGHSKALAEKRVLKYNPNALIVRTSAFFGPWDKYNFVTLAISALKEERPFHVVKDVFVSPTYVPDLVNNCLNLLLDDEKGIWHLSNEGQITWADLAYTVAERSGYKRSLISPILLEDYGYIAKRPHFSALSTEKGVILPQLDNAIDRCLEAINN